MKYSIPILITLSYADIFDYPLTAKEIFRFLVLVGQHAIRNTQQEVEKQLVKNSYLASHVTCRDGYYCLKGREKIFPIRRQREFWSKSKIRRAEKVAVILRLIPWIKLIGITGGLARNNSEKDDDIDLFFITAKNRLWLTRGLVVLILSILGLYRRPNKFKDMICPNMFVAESALKMEPEDIFTAHEVCLLKPIFVRENTYQKFLMANLWIKKFLPNTLESKIYSESKIRYMKTLFSYNLKSKIDKSEKKNSKILLFTFYFLNLVECVARDLQLWYMRKKRTTELVSDSLIKFHPQDARNWVLQEYQKRLNKVSLDSEVQ